MDTLVGSMLGNGRYQIERKIGIGGQGSVYIGKDLRLQIPVAIKVLPWEYAIQAQSQGRFEREAQRLAQLRHPNIVVVHDYACENNVCYIVSDYIPGPTLRTLLVQRKGPLPQEQALAYIRQIGGALQYAHDNKIIHRDVKPSNILIDERDGRAVLVDFGLARLTEQENLEVTTEEHAAPGTPAYMSPEQCLSQPVDQRTDIYSLALVIYELLTGRHPLLDEGDTSATIRRKQVTQIPPPLQLADYSRRANDVLSKALAKEPERRYATISALITALEEALGESSSREPIWRTLVKLGAWFQNLLGTNISMPTFWLVIEAVVLLSLGAGFYRVLVHPAGSRPSPSPSPTMNAPTIHVTPLATAISDVMPTSSRPITSVTETIEEIAQSIDATRVETTFQVRIVPTATHLTTPTLAPSSTTTETLTNTPTPTRKPSNVIKPSDQLAIDVGQTGYRRIEITSVTYANGALRINGAILRPEQHYADQHWSLEWVGDDVVGACGIPPTDGRIHWNPLSMNQAGDAPSILGEWKPETNINCVIWVRLVVWTNNNREKRYAKFDLNRLGIPCISRKCPG